MAFAIILVEMCEMKSNERNDPGIIFLFAVDTQIDACLAIMPPMLAHLPRLTRGMNDLRYYGLMTGANPAQSKSNLQSFINAVRRH